MVTGPPADTPVTRPVALTVATASALELHAMARLLRVLPWASLVVAESCAVVPATMLDPSGETVTEATGCGGGGGRGGTIGSSPQAATTSAAPIPVKKSRFRNDMTSPDRSDVESRGPRMRARIGHGTMVPLREAERSTIPAAGAGVNPSSGAPVKPVPVTSQAVD